MKKPYMQKIIEGEIEKTLCYNFLMDFMEFDFRWDLNWCFGMSLIGMKGGKLSRLHLQLRKDVIENFQPEAFLEEIELAARKHGVSLEPVRKANK